jgi:quinol monooxygenase YgiN
MSSRRAMREISLGSLQPAEPPMEVHFDAAERKLNARAVEFIAKPGKAEELRGFLRQAVAPLLRDRAGFLRSIVLTTHGAPRRVVMITFWNTERRMLDLWEENPVVRKGLSPLIDAASRTSSYQVDVTEIIDAPSQTMNVQVANRSRISTTVYQQAS